MKRLVVLAAAAASWGSRENRLNPTWATNAFLDKMLRVAPDWRTAPIGEVCQKVQVSATPYAYQPQAGDGTKIVAELWNAPGVPVPVGSDVNGDGHRDLVMVDRNGAASGLWTFRGGPGGFGAQVPIVQSKDDPGYAEARVLTGHFNGDLYADVLIARPNPANAGQTEFLVRSSSGADGRLYGPVKQNITFGRPLAALDLA